MTVVAPPICHYVPEAGNPNNGKWDMTKWAGETLYQTISRGTTVLIFENPYVTGSPPASLAPGDKVQVRLGHPDQRMIDATVVDVGGGKATLEFADKTRWIMTPLQPGEFGSGIKYEGAPTQEWVFRESA
jgi:hypothetical protein